MRRTLRVACARVSSSVHIIFAHVFVSYELILIYHTNLSCNLAVRSAENNIRKDKAMLLQGAGLYIAKKHNPFWKINAESKESNKILINYYILGNSYIND